MPVTTLESASAAVEYWDSLHIVSAKSRNKEATAPIMYTPEASTFSETCLASSWGAQNCAATAAEDYCLRVAEYGGYLKASRALDVHEITIGCLNQPLELVLLQLKSLWRAAQRLHKNIHK